MFYFLDYFCYLPFGGYYCYLATLLLIVISFLRYSESNPYLLLLTFCSFLVEKPK